MGLSGKYENEDRSWLSQYLPKTQSELPPRSMNVSVNTLFIFLFLCLTEIIKMKFFILL